MKTEDPVKRAGNTSDTKTLIFLCRLRMLSALNLKRNLPLYFNN